VEAELCRSGFDTAQPAVDRNHWATPVNTPACGEPVAVSVKLIDPVWVPTDPKRLKVAWTVQEAPGAKLTPVQLSVPFVQDQIKPDPETDTPVTATLDELAALLVKVTVPLPESVPEGSVTVSGFGEIATAAAVVTREPVNCTGVGVTVAPV
jgi:hypothetical protein